MQIEKCKLQIGPSILMDRCVVALLVVLFLLNALPCVATAQDTPGWWTLQRQTELVDGQRHPGVEVMDLSDDDLRTINELGIESETGQSLLQLYVADSDTPALGRVLLVDHRLVFEPRFALAAGVSYRAEFNANHVRNVWLGKPLTLEFSIEREAAPAPTVLARYPVHEELPQNLLRMYLQFSQPMAQGNAYQHIRFLNDQGEPIEQPYLSIPQELWNPDGTRLTLLFDPGRIKRGLTPHEELGPPFEAGETYTVVVDPAWKSADGMALSEDFRSTFTMQQPDRIQPALARWQLDCPASGSSDPLVVHFDEPLDHGMIQHAIAVMNGDDEQVGGTVKVPHDARSWSFHPDQPWPAGEYWLNVNPRLEDRAGNSLAQPFEVDPEAPTEETSPQTRLDFTIAQGTADDRPNIVFILADDLGWRDLSCTGSTFYESPNIDRICDEGMRFSRGYAACQVCSPSRAAIMTGKAPARLKITDYIGAPSGTEWKRNTRLLPAFYRRHLPHEETTLAEAFRGAGYRTFFAGKWHLGGEGSLPEDHGFEFNVGGYHPGTPPGGFFAPYENPKMSDGPPGECLPVRLGKETADFIALHQDEPFLAYLSFYSVHAPIQTKQTLWQKYRDKTESHTPTENRFIIDRTMPVRQTQDHPVYAGMVESMDYGVGIVLDKLDELGLADNTIVVFTSDNGGVSSGDGFATSNLPLRGGKGRQWEGGIREPYFVRWPAEIAAGSTCDTPVTGMDFYPTLLDLAGLPPRPDQHRDGVSLKPLLEGGEIAQRTLVWYYPHYGNQGGEPSSIFMDGDRKLIRYLEDGRLELYNLSEDAGEQNNLADQFPEMADLMFRLLEIKLLEMSAEMPTANPNFDEAAYAAWQRRMRDERMPNLERNHVRFLDEDFVPGGGWWDQK
ncbi:MAG: sulfatase-like hydrolase/transferase [Pirellulaceae bacterium]